MILINTILQLLFNVSVNWEKVSRFKKFLIDNKSFELYQSKNVVI